MGYGSFVIHGVHLAFPDAADERKTWDIHCHGGKISHIVPASSKVQASAWRLLDRLLSRVSVIDAEGRGLLLPSYVLGVLYCASNKP